jgi:FtsP/CotA-like multicopper oxidase with cupredoxin domain
MLINAQSNTLMAAGILRPMLVINGQFPGPLIEVNRGDRVLVNVTNNLSNASTIHWHGLYQNGTNWMDGTSGITQCPIPPGRSFLYNFTVENQYGTFWYHSHTSTQYMVCREFKNHSRNLTLRIGWPHRSVYHPCTRRSTVPAELRE